MIEQDLSKTTPAVINSKTALSTTAVTTIATDIAKRID